MIDFFLAYLQNEKRSSKHTITAYKTDLAQFNTYITQEFNVKSSQATFKHIRLWVASLSEQQLERKSINRKIASVRSFYTYLLRQNKIEANPAEQLKSLKTAKKPPVFVEEKAFAKLLDFEEFFEEGLFGLRDRLIIEMLYQLGIRLSELINIKLSDIDFENKHIKVIGKGNKMRLIPITEMLLGLLNSYLELSKSNEFLFLTNSGKKLYPMFVQRLVKKQIQKVSTIKNISPHTLRHSFATHLLNNGADLNAIKELLGHANLAATQIYTHNSIEKLKEVHKLAHPKS